MKVLLLAAAASVICSSAIAQSPRTPSAAFQFTAMAAGGDNFKTVYYGKGVAGAVQVCTTTKGVHVRAHSGEQINVSTLTSPGECTVVVAEKVTVVPYVVQDPTATVNVTILGIAGIYGASN